MRRAELHPVSSGAAEEADGGEVREHGELGVRGRRSGSHQGRMTWGRSAACKTWRHKRGGSEAVGTQPRARLGHELLVASSGSGCPPPPIRRRPPMNSTPTCAPAAEVRFSRLGGSLPRCRRLVGTPGAVRRHVHAARGWRPLQPKDKSREGKDCSSSSQQRATASPVNCSTLGRGLAASPFQENTTMLFLEISFP
uniref:Uncharacterized protein n=1 Tax=Setaria viridis TaxID=4556 RepID=A0A4U6V1A0_SETVI|nr:hypothetical protein SEVIR_4G253600v2 [Setaria viridis]